MRFLARLLLNALAIAAVAWLLPGLRLSGPGAGLLAGAVLGLINALIRPVLFILTLPLTLVTLGLFIFVLNAFCLMMTAWLIPGFEVDGFWWAVLGALLVSIVSWILSGLLLAPDERQRR